MCALILKMSGQIEYTELLSSSIGHLVPRRFWDGWVVRSPWNIIISCNVQQY